MRKIAIVGPESSGKTSLANALAMHYDVGVIEEVAREHLAELGRPYQETDLLDIAISQKESQEKEDRYLEEMFSMMDPTGEKYRTGNIRRLLICDTDMITIRIWSQEKYDRVDPKLERLVHETHYDYWLLCMPDIPWEPDPLRENPGDRDRLFTLYENTLKELGKPYIVISGDREKRLCESTALIDVLMQGDTTNN